MSVIDFRPHIFQYLISTEQGSINDDGDYIPLSEIIYSEPEECNAVPNTGNAKVLNAEGRQIEYAFTIYAKCNIKNFEFGELIRLVREGITHELTVKGFQRYKHFAKLWV